MLVDELPLGAGDELASVELLTQSIDLTHNASSSRNGLTATSMTGIKSLFCDGFFRYPFGSVTNTGWFVQATTEDLWASARATVISLAFYAWLFALLARLSTPQRLAARLGAV